MPKKISSGDYKCRFCDKIMSRYKQAKNHESTCIDNNLSQFLPIVENIVHISGSKNSGKTHSKQLKLGQNIVGSCFNCDRKISEDQRLKEDRPLFECVNCGNINRIEV